MSDLKQTMQRAREFIAANLAECCRDELDWQNTALLRDGKLREAAAIYSKVDTTHAIPLAQAEVARQAMQFVCRTQPETVDGDPIGDLQAESRQAKLDDFIASMKTQPEATAPAQDLAQEQAATMLIQRKKIQTLNAEIAELRKKLSGVNSAAHRLAARLCAIPPAKTIRGNDLITREAVMGFVVEWRRQWDEANEAALASSANALIAGIG